MLNQFAKNYIEYNNKIKKLDLNEYYKNNSNINSAFVISLDKDFERYRETIELLDSLKLDCKIIKFPAVNGKSLKRSNRTIYNIFRKINPSEIGCFISHFVLYYIASEHSNPNAYTLIFEDDIALNNNTKNNIKQKITDLLIHDPDMVYLGKCFESCSNMAKIKDDLYYGYNPVCFHSYMIKNSFAKQVVDYINAQSVIDEPIDNLVVKLIKSNKLLVFHPSLFIQNIKWESNLRDKKKQHFNTTECSNIRKMKKMIEHFDVHDQSTDTLKEFIINYIHNLNDINLLAYYDNDMTEYNNPFVISLKSDMIKFDNTQKLLQSLNMEPIKFDAIYGKNLDKNILDLFTNLSNNEIGCMLSHISVLYLISKHKSKNQYSIIFEDDIMLNSDINLNSDILKQKISNAIDHDPKLIYLGKCYEVCSNMKQINDDIYYGNRPLCLHAYMIKNSYAKTIIDYIFSQNKISVPIDNLIPQITKDNEIIVFHPSLFYQNLNYTSNLRGKISQYYGTIDCNNNILKIKLILIFFIIFFIIGIIFVFKKLNV